jgi:hypothetical protein
MCLVKALTRIQDRSKKALNVEANLSAMLLKKIFRSMARNDEPINITKR